MSHEKPHLTNTGPVPYSDEDAHRPLESGMVISVETTLSIQGAASSSSRIRSPSPTPASISTAKAHADGISRRDQSAGVAGCCCVISCAGGLLAALDRCSQCVRASACRRETWGRVHRRAVSQAGGQPWSLG